MKQPSQRAEILKRYQACLRKLGRAPGRVTFCRATGIRAIEIYNYWPRFSDLTREAGATPNQYNAALSAEQIFREYARVCLYLRKIPNSRELLVANRKLGTRATSVYTKYGSIIDFDQRFLDWLLHGEEKFKPIIAMAGWQRKGQLNPPQSPLPVLSPFPFLPSVLHDLDTLARAESVGVERSEEGAQNVFAQRCYDAFRALGFKVERLGAGKGPIPDFSVLAQPFHVALDPAGRFAVLLDPQSRPRDYVFPTRNPEFEARVRRHARRLAKEGFPRSYLALVGPSFRESDLAELVQYLPNSGLSGITLLAATALMRTVSDSIRDRASFSLPEFEATLTGNRIVRD